MTGIPAPVPAQPFGMAAHPIPQYDPQWNNDPFIRDPAPPPTSGSDTDSVSNFNRHGSGAGSGSRDRPASAEPPRGRGQQRPPTAGAMKRPRSGEPGGSAERSAEVRQPSSGSRRPSNTGRPFTGSGKGFVFPTAANTFAGKGRGPERDQEFSDARNFDGKKFEHIKHFKGESAEYRAWYFDLVVAFGRCDPYFSREFKSWYDNVLDNGDGAKPMKAHDYKPENDDDLMKRGIWARYRNLLGSILAMITDGEAKGIIRGLNEKGEELDGFKVMALFKERYDHIREGNSILRLLGDILHPPEIKKRGGSL